MNAYELAEQAEGLAYEIPADWSSGEPKNVATDIADMLRQQADRIAELEKGGEVAGRFYWESVVDGHVMAVPSEGTPHYNKDDFPLYTTPQIKELSDEEIKEVIRKHWNKELGNRGMLTLCKACLKKASEK